MGDIFDNGIGPKEMGVILGITEEIAEEEAEAKNISNDPLTPEEMLKTGNDVFDNVDDNEFDEFDQDELPDFDDQY